jgi:ABC-type lipoprotein export system ATPase subunit
MELLVENLKNIEYLKTDFEDKKMNFVFGISGSGKSAIANALTSSEINDYIKVGKKTENLKILVNGAERNLSQFAVYDEKQVENLYLYSEDGSDAYEIIFSNNENYIEAVNEFEKIVHELSSHKNKLMDQQRIISKLLDTQSIKKLTAKGDLPKTADVNKIIDIHSKTNSTSLNMAISYGQDKVGWLKKGRDFEEFNKNICPFCEESLSNNRITEVNDISSIDNKFFKVIESDKSIYDELKIPKPDYFDVETLKEHSMLMISYVNILNDLVAINDFLELARIEDLDPKKLTKINVSKDFEDKFPEVYKIVQETNINLETIKQQLSKIKYQMKNIISTNINEINNTLKYMGIKYKIVERPIKPNEKRASFLLKHVDETKEDVNQVSFLSTGEKNIIALIFFMIKNQRKNLIIDDPASSFDEYRRKIIFNYIKKKYKKRTVIVLSHDEVFSKFAIKAKYMEKNADIGIVKFMSNYDGTPKMLDITVEDYKSLSSFIKNKLASTDIYLSKIINCRLLLEIECQSQGQTTIEYGYLSAIIHGTSAEDIEKLLIDKNVLENDLLSSIEKSCGIILPKIKEVTDEMLKVDGLSNYEKVFYLRENEQDPIIKSEMSELIHLNDRLAICLNPYKFDTFSPYLYDRITGKS